MTDLDERGKQETMKRDWPNIGLRTGGWKSNVWVDGLLLISLMVNAALALLVWIFSFGPLSFQTVKTFMILASGRPLAEIECLLGRGHDCRPIQGGSDTADGGTFWIHPAAQVYPVSDKVYIYPARFPPGFFLVHADREGYVEHLRFYSSDGTYDEDGVRR